MYEYKNLKDLSDEEINALGNKYKLCYAQRHDDVRDGDYYIEKIGFRLYFTPVSFCHQWGDDWDDAPYEMNAGEPYDSYFKDGKRIDYTILVLQIYVDVKDELTLPEDCTYNSRFTVADINSGLVAWLFMQSQGKNINGIAVHAGATPYDVITKLGKYLVNK